MILFFLFVLVVAVPLLVIFIGALLEDAGVTGPHYDHGRPKIVDPYDGWPMPLILTVHPAIEDTLVYPSEEITLEIPVVKESVLVDTF